MKAKITSALLNNLALRDKPFKVWDTEHSGLFARVSPKGTITYALRYRSPVDLKDKTLTIGRSDRIPPAEARRIATQRAGEIARGLDPQLDLRQRRLEAIKQEVATLGDFMAKRYEDYLRSEKVSGDSLIRDIRGIWGDFYEKDLTSFDAWFVTNWRNKRLEQGIKKATVNRNTALLRALLSRAVDWQIIDSNPMSSVKQLPLDKTPKIRYLSNEELSRLQSALQKRDAQALAKSHFQDATLQENDADLRTKSSFARYTDHLTPLVTLCLNTGVRKGEAFDLTWENVDLSSKLITIVGASSKNRQTRHVPLSNAAAKSLGQWQNQQGLSSGLVFPSPVTGLRLTDVKTAWKNIRKAAELKNFRFHDIRHHFASTLVMRGVELNTVRELMGHSSIEMTLRYAHLAPEHKAAAIARLDEPGYEAVT